MQSFSPEKKSYKKFHICKAHDLVAYYADGHVQILGDRSVKGKENEFLRNHAFVVQRQKRKDQGLDYSIGWRFAEEGEEVYDPRPIKKTSNTHLHDLKSA